MIRWRMEINAFQIQNILRTYEHLIKLKPVQKIQEGLSDEGRESPDLVTLSPESIEKYHNQTKIEQEDSVQPEE